MEHLFSSKKGLISREKKEILLNQKGTCLWLTGLSGSGKTTIAKVVSEKLHKNGILTNVLDGDNIRLGINSNLTFSEDDRLENVRRTAEIAKLFVECGVVTICCLVSPTVKIRKLAKKIIGEKDFYEMIEVIDANTEKICLAKAHTSPNNDDLKVSKVKLFCNF